MTVTLVTQDATLDNLSTGDYRDIYTELRRLEVEGEKPISFDRFIAAIGSQYSKGQWAKYDSGEIGLTRQMRSELRVAAGLPPLPPTVAEATAAASPDAAVWMVGDGIAKHVIMVSSTPVTLCVNGTVQTVIAESHVTEVTRPPRTRKRVVRPFVPFEYKERLERLETVYAGVSWLDVIDAGFEVYETEMINDGTTETQ